VTPKRRNLQSGRIRRRWNDLPSIHDPINMFENPGINILESILPHPAIQMSPALKLIPLISIDPKRIAQPGVADIGVLRLIDGVFAARKEEDRDSPQTSQVEIRDKVHRSSRVGGCRQIGHHVSCTSHGHEVSERRHRSAA
jgi:hypothetical protein